MASQSTEFQLINATNDTVIEVLFDGVTISVADNPSIAIEAITSPGVTGSVVFNLSGASSHNPTESVFPYALYGDNAGNFNEWTSPPLGDYVLTATPYPLSGGRGTPGTPLTINFTISDSPANLPPTASYTTDNTSGEAPLTVNLDASGSSDSDGSIVSYDWDFGDTTTGTGATTSVTYNNAGSYTILLTVTDDDGATDTTSVVIDVSAANLPPTASFTADNTSGEAPLTVNLDASGSSDSDGSIASYDWDFGDTTTGTGATTSVTYNNAGSYTILLTVTDDDGATDTTSVVIDVSAANLPPTASFTADNTSGEAPLTVNLDASGSSDSDGSIVSYDWDFGDTTTGTGATTSVTYNNAGSYTILLTVTDDDGATDTTSVVIDVSAANLPPTASFTADNTSGEAPLTVNLDASGSSDSDGSIASYDWDFGDTTTGTGATTSVTYNNAGSYTILLTVTDDDGATDTTSVVIDVSAANLPPTASFTADNTSGEAPLTVNLDASGSSDTDGSIASYDWDFGDTTTGTGATTSVTYNNAGSYTILLTVTDDDGATDTTSVVIDVSAAILPPTASFTADNTSGEAPLTVNLDASGSSDSDGSIASYDWDFGDTTTGTGATTSVTYNNAGSYTILLTVTDDDGATDTTSVVIDVSAANLPPTASFTADNTSGEAPLTVNLDASGSSDSDGSIVSYDWDFGDTTTGTGATTSVTYNNAGSYTILLTVTDDDGATDTTSVVIDVSAANLPPTASFTADNTSGEAPLTVNLDASGSSDSDGSIVSYDWDFGDTTTGTGATTSVTYNNAGAYTILLTVTDDDGATDTTSVVIDVSAANLPPTASFTADSTSGEAPLTVNLDASGSSDSDGSIVSYDWDFGDTTTGTGATTSVTYNNAGAYTILLTVTDDDGATDTTSVVIDVSAANLPPTASFTADNTSGEAPLTVNLDASGSSDSDGSIASYDWDFGDTTTGTGATTSVTYNNAGSYSILLTVTDDDGATDTTSVVIDVTSINTPPTASFTADSTSGEAPLTVNLDASGSSDSDGSIVSYDWDFGDTTTGTEAATSVTYNNAGSYTILLTVTDDDGADN